MAKQLLSSYSFTPGAANAGTVVVPGTYTLEQFLLITNVTSGTIIYQFNVPSKGAVRTVGGGNTTLTLEFSTQSMSAADRLQVFIDDLTTGGGGGGGGGGGLTDTELRATPVPVSVSGVATAANQSTGNSSLSSIDGKTPALVSGRVPVDGSGVTQPVSGSVTVSGTVTASGPLTDTQLRATAVPVSGTFWQATQPISGSVSVTGTTAVSGPLTDSELRATAVPVSGTFWQATQPVSGTVTANAGTNLNTSALAVETGGNLATLAGRVPAQGQALMAASLPVAIASNQSALTVNRSLAPALLTSYTQAGVITINTVLAMLDCSLYRSVSIQCTSMGTTGVVTPEWSNDNTTWVTATILTQAGATATTFNAAGLWVVPVQARYLRLRLSTATTAGTTTLSIHQFDDSRQFWLATQPVSGTVTSNIGTGTVAAVTAANLALPGIIADVASAALTTTTTTAAFTPTFGISYTVNIPVTAVTGTTPTLDVSIEESDDSGTNWFTVYQFPRITAAGMYRSPLIRMVGNRVRYAQTVGGTTPSFTRAINRLQNSTSADAVRQLIDRSISLTTLNSTTPSLDTRDAGNRAQLVVNVGAITTTAPALQMEGSDDNGASWYAIGTPLTAVASSTVQVTVVDINAALMRARVSTAGSGVTAGYVMIKAHD